MTRGIEILEATIVEAVKGIDMVAEIGLPMTCLEEMEVIDATRQGTMIAESMTTRDLAMTLGTTTCVAIFLTTGARARVGEVQVLETFHPDEEAVHHPLAVSTAPGVLLFHAVARLRPSVTAEMEALLEEIVTVLSLSAMVETEVLEEIAIDEAQVVVDGEVARIEVEYYLFDTHVN